MQFKTQAVKSYQYKHHEIIGMKKQKVAGYSTIALTKC